MKMRKILCLLLVIALLATCTVKPALASIKLEYVDIPVKVENNEVKTERMYGYFTEVTGIGEVFIVCHSDGTPTGKAWLPDAVVGELTEEKFIGYTPPGEPRKILDFDNPIIVTAPGVLAGTARIRMPNIPTRKWFWDTERGAFVTRNQAGIPLKGGFKYLSGRTYRPYTFLIPGRDPLYRLQVAEVTNPNLVTIKTTIRTNVNEAELTLNPGETKAVLLNPIKDNTRNWDENKQSLRVTVSDIISDSFPEVLRREDGILDILLYSDYYRFPFASGGRHFDNRFPFASGDCWSDLQYGVYGAVIGDDGTIHRPSVYDNAWNLDTPLFTSKLIEQNKSTLGNS